jgi:tRNA(Arg) A34 adenosine deaminase TadA
MTSDSIVAWQHAGPGVRRSLERAHRSLLAGGLPVGAVLLDGAGEPVAEGRNRAYDPPGGDDRLQGTPIAHAEMNALAHVATSTDLSTMTLWSSHRPCAMCAAACEFTGVGSIRFVAPDPSSERYGPDPTGVRGCWLIVANLLFLAGVRAYVGVTAPMIERARGREPETTDLLDATTPEQLRVATLPEALAPIWPHVVDAASRRHQRVES